MSRQRHLVLEGLNARRHLRNRENDNGRYLACGRGPLYRNDRRFSGTNERCYGSSGCGPGDDVEPFSGGPHGLWNIRKEKRFSRRRLRWLDRRSETKACVAGIRCRWGNLLCRQEGGGAPRGCKEGAEFSSIRPDTSSQATSAPIRLRDGVRLDKMSLRPPVRERFKVCDSGYQGKHERFCTAVLLVNIISKNRPFASRPIG